MRLGRWLILGMLSCPVAAAVAAAQEQKVTERDLVGGWRAEVERASINGAEERNHMAAPDKLRAWLVLWPDGLWWYSGAFHFQMHGGARWRLVGDTLWLGGDWYYYYHQIVDDRLWSIQEKGYGVSVMDTAIINRRPPFIESDSLYWSDDYRSRAGEQGGGECGDPTSCVGSWTWVYKVAKRDKQIYLTRLESLSRGTKGVATTAVLTRDTLTNCRHSGSASRC